MAAVPLLQMQLPNPPLTAAERAARSVFVGNIPYEATEEQLKDIFIQAGPVVSFRLVYDRETGKPKGYGFCEYQDVETAQSAMRNLNNYDFNGRPLRVGVAAGEQTKEELKSLQQALGGPPVESPYGDLVEPEKAPEAISKAVASLPPEQMFELMKQMKLCIQNNPTEARNMLMQNPQLAYALLQAQIVMKIVDPQVAMAMLHRDKTQIPPSEVSSETPQTAVQPQPQPEPQQPQQTFAAVPRASVPQAPSAPIMPGPSVPGAVPTVLPNRMGASNVGRMEIGMPAGIRPQAGQPSPFPNQPMRGMPSELRDPRQMGDVRGMPSRPSVPNVSKGLPMPGMAGLASVTAGGIPNLSSLTNPQISSQDQEKAALIMQVLHLTDEQIDMLPPDQRQSILILKDQIAKSAN